jgi:hypothetical protein
MDFPELTPAERTYMFCSAATEYNYLSNIDTILDKLHPGITIDDRFQVAQSVFVSLASKGLIEILRLRYVPYEYSRELDFRGGQRVVGRIEIGQFLAAIRQTFVKDRKKLYWPPTTLEEAAFPDWFALQPTELGMQLKDQMLADELAAECPQCLGFGECYFCIQTGSGDPSGCTKCDGSGKCSACSGTGKK